MSIVKLPGPGYTRLDHEGVPRRNGILMASWLLIPGLWWPSDGARGGCPYPYPTDLRHLNQRHARESVPYALDTLPVMVATKWDGHPLHDRSNLANWTQTADFFQRGMKKTVHLFNGPSVFSPRDTAWGTSATTRTVRASPLNHIQWNGSIVQKSWKGPLSVRRLIGASACVYIRTSKLWKILQPTKTLWRTTSRALL